jgi:hypothetical protein
MWLNHRPALFDHRVEVLIINSMSVSVSESIPTGVITHAYNGCELVVNALAVLTRFRVELGLLGGSVLFCARCCPIGPATCWPRNLKEHLVATRAAEVHLAMLGTEPL